ncbi:MAG: DUF134 domain-containing protein [Syntrophomonadaceae bacterium]|nr:DUF134 domain-containing protein [Syntrophomonadaceae bacterium]MDD3889030.1 DUF134 domain-containing protein [Syntrophomonadaceae bacterium]MDD4549245.1 DUF134 domain-containing protein [Syntrophomonadaceae bacterium]
MPRPRKCRMVGFIPNNQYFYPQQSNSEEVCLNIEEVEAIRLSDLEGMEQVAAAELMSISRGTYQRIINDARKKIADAIINGKAIRIEGGNYKFKGGHKSCMGHCCKKFRE